jgi:hypothetical protein
VTWNRRITIDGLEARSTPHVKEILWIAAAFVAATLGAPNLAGAQWVPNGQVLCQASNAQNTPTVVTDGVWGAIVAWRDTRNAGGSDEDIFATRVTRAGGVGLWPPNGVALCTATGTQMAEPANDFETLAS